MEHDDREYGLADGDNPRTAARQLRLALARARLQMRVVGEIGQAPEILSGNVDALARMITERAALTIGCERVNIWLFDDDETTLRCIDDYTASTKAHVAGATLNESQFRKEFHALKNSRYVAADQPQLDPRTRGYTDSYLQPLGITSMLDTVIQISGKHLGLLCFERVGVEHHWQRDEVAFAEQLADKLGLALVSRARRQVEDAVRRSEAELHEAQRVARLGSWVWYPDTDEQEYSPELFRILDLDPSKPAPLLQSLSGVIVPASFDALTAAARTAQMVGTPYTLDIQFRRSDGWLLVRGEAEHDAAGVCRRLRGTALDISDRKAAEDALTYRDRVLHAVMDSSVGFVAAGIDDAAAWRGLARPCRGAEARSLDAHVRSGCRGWQAGEPGTGMAT